MQFYWRRVRIHWQSIKGIVLPGLSVIAIITAVRAFGGFQFLEWAAFDAGLKLRPIEPIDDRIVLIGMTANSVKDILPVEGALAPSIGLHGVEYHAHATSQILSAVLDRRPLLETWHDIWEYLWVAGWGSIGIGLAWVLRTPQSLVFSMLAVSGTLIGITYGLLVLG